jgi:hypothetical protein
MKDYNYWLTDWPKICLQTFAHAGQMFEVTVTKDTQGISHYTTGRELDLDEALLNAKPDRRVMTMAVFAGNGKKEDHDGRLSQ